MTYNENTAERRADALKDAEHEAGLDYEKPAPAQPNYKEGNRDVHDVAGKGANRDYEPKNWPNEDSYWRKEYQNRPYVHTARYTLYQPAYRYGALLRQETPKKSFSELSEENLRSRWEENRQESTLEWEEARPAIEDAYNRVSASR